MASSGDWYSVLKDFAGPVATVIAATAAVVVSGYFAWQQSTTAKRQAETAIDQLRFNLFEKRYAVYDTIQKFLDTLITADADKLAFGAFDETPYFRVFDEAPFLFSETTCKWLETIRADCEAVLYATRQAGAAELGSDKQLELGRHSRALPERFRDDMSFRQLTRR